MERINKLFGLKERQTATVDKTEASLSQQDGQKSTEQNQGSQQSNSGSHSPDPVNNPIEKPVIQQNIEKFVTKYLHVPLREGECLGCKLVPSCAITVAGVGSFMITMKNEMGYIGWRRSCYRMAGFGIMTTATLGAYMILFDAGIFMKNEDGKPKPFDEMLEADWNNFKSFFTKPYNKYFSEKPSNSDNCNDR